jgi:HlyD family secretion protein
MRLSRKAQAGLAGIVVLALAGGLAAALAPLRQGGEVPVYQVASGPFARRVAAEGNLQAVRATPLLAPQGVEGVSLAWLAPDGSFVRTGEAVARFDPTEMEKTLLDAQGELTTSRLRIGKEKAESGAELGRLAKDAEIAAAELASAREFQKKDPLIFSRSEIIESEVDEGLARERSKHAREAGERRRALARADLGLLEIAGGQASYRIDKAEQGLQALSLIAPHDGIVVLQRDWHGEPIRVGDAVWAGQSLAEIPDLSRMEAEVFVLESDAGGLAVGQRAEVEVESASGTVWGARVALVDTLAKPRFRKSPVQYFAVTLALDQTARERMKPGARVRARITVERRPQALSVPRQAVFEREGKTVVYRKSATGFKPVAVALGPASAGRVVVERGLAAGDRVALRDPSQAPASPTAPASSSPPSPSAEPVPPTTPGALVG